MDILQGYSAVLTLVMLGVVLRGVFYRYLMFQALSWYDEFASDTLVWLTMYGSVVALARGKHISFETLVEKLPRVWQHVSAILATVCILAFSLVVLVSGWGLVLTLSAMNVPIGFVLAIATIVVVTIQGTAPHRAHRPAPG